MFPDGLLEMQYQLDSASPLKLNGHKDGSQTGWDVKRDGSVFPASAMEKCKPITMPRYKVMVDDNFHVLCAQNAPLGRLDKPSC
jgi:hypothetical protein